MNIPQMISTIDELEPDTEQLKLDELIKTAKKTFDFEGIVHGGISSLYQKNKFEKLENLSKKFQFNLNFEGGEAETFVTNCPLFKNRIKITNSSKIWDGIRGRFEIVESKLENNA